MLYHFEFVKNAGIYDINNDVLDFFQKSISQSKYSPLMLNEKLRQVVADSSILETKFKNVFKELGRDPIDKNVVYNFLSNNNNVVELLTNISYPLLKLNSPEYDNLFIKIKELYIFMWNSTLTTQTCANNYGTLSQHYVDHDKLNKKSRRICPFCGLVKLDDPAEKRNEYDHYLDKNTFPYLSLNFYNLVPMCGKCNKRPNKGTKNLIFNTNGTRRIAYNPYSTVKPFEITLSCNNIFLPDEKWILTTNSDKPDIGFKTWKTVFKIDSRYRNYIKSEFEFWLDQFTSYCKRYGTLPDTVTDFKTKVQEYLRDILVFFNDELGHFLHLKFWNYLIDIADSDLELIITLMKEKSEF